VRAQPPHPSGELRHSRGSFVETILGRVVFEPKRRFTWARFGSNWGWLPPVDRFTLLVLVDIAMHLKTLKAMTWATIGAAVASAVALAAHAPVAARRAATMQAASAADVASMAPARAMDGATHAAWREHGAAPRRF
jgi:hypothetical protein